VRSDAQNARPGSIRPIIHRQPTDPTVKSIRHFLDRSAPLQGGATLSRASWKRNGDSRMIGRGEPMVVLFNVQHPGEGSA
jgi:hypothetical protein